MRKLKLEVQLSVNGYVGGVSGDLNWTVSLYNKYWRLLHDIVGESDTLLIGRKIAEEFIPHFESFTVDHLPYSFAQKMVHIPKVTFTKPLNKPFGKNISHAKAGLSAKVCQPKHQNGKDLLVYEGASFVSALISRGHIDKLLLFINPVLIRHGLQIFVQVNEQQVLILISARSYKCGVRVLHYKMSSQS
ncbi:dihydrofolate reductase family protein [Porifericola rhodea]|uniref:dihydrofolate reductase family protein n=1 Tax=Porifericola rhodea TaxID=930972 RepID=UPI002665D9CA|nr:dihydrofolate reductase family protein [Porifericola rhodea]WKN30333.1 dihydrofolate reductase family protein [Porifericola rhodea]